MVWGGDPLSVATPPELAGFARFGALVFPNYRLAIIVIAFVVAVGLWLLLDRTRLGAMTKLKFKGVEILTNVAGRELSDPDFAPFWKKAEELEALVIIHPNGFTEGRRLSRFYFNNIIGNPFETTLALHYLIFDGVLERHPNLKIFAMHECGDELLAKARRPGKWQKDCGRQARRRRPQSRSREGVSWPVA